jgi:hypothetical protein
MIEEINEFDSILMKNSPVAPCRFHMNRALSSFSLDAFCCSIMANISPSRPQRGGRGLGRPFGFSPVQQQDQDGTIFFIGDSTIEPIDESLFIEKHGGYASARWPATFMCPWLSWSH